MNCSICLDTINPNENYTTKCSHHFHHKCMIHWLVNNDNCPVCRCSLNCQSTIKKKSRIAINPQIFTKLTEQTQYKLISYVIDIVDNNTNGQIIPNNKYIDIVISNKSRYVKDSDCIQIINVDNTYFLNCIWSESVCINSNINEKNKKKMKRSNNCRFKTKSFRFSRRFKSVFR